MGECPVRRVLVANRGEIAVRVLRAAADYGMEGVAVFSPEDASALHRSLADEALALEGRGVAAYLDQQQLIQLACEHHCDAVHPGYGFLSESAEFARAVEAAGLIFVGPNPETLAELGNKVSAIRLAERCDVPILRSSPPGLDQSQAADFFNSLQGSGVMVKALAGGGGRGMRVVQHLADLSDAMARAASEAGAAFGDTEVFLEELVHEPRHIEVQVAGDGTGAAVHLWERECTIQRRHQKLLELAPSPSLTDEVRGELCAAAVRMAQAVRYRGVGTFEFLLSSSGRWTFMEANPRLQVEHTVTEEVTGYDLVQIQLALASGQSLAELELQQSQIARPRGYALQARINTETLTADGDVKPAGGTLSVWQPPAGLGVRLDTAAFAGYTTSPAFDSLLAKLVVHSTSTDFRVLVRRAARALADMQIEGVATNLPLLRNILNHPRFVANDISTSFIADELESLVASDSTLAEQLAGAKVESQDPLAVLDHGKGGSFASHEPVSVQAPLDESLPQGVVVVKAPMQGTVVSFLVEPGDAIHLGRQVLVMEAMKMEHVIEATVSGVVERLGVEIGDTVFENHPLVYVREALVDRPAGDSGSAVDLDLIRADLQEVLDRKAAGHDAQRPQAVAKRRKTGHRTARENIEDLCDPGTFAEYGSVVLAAQRRRRSLDDLIANTTGDGMVCGLGQINGALFGPERSRAMLMSYDYMVLAGTQGMKNHAKKDRMFEIAQQFRLPTVLFAEGGGGRPGDTDGSGVAGLDCLAFTYFAELSGLVPTVGITTGRCFAGNAVLLSCCDVIIATEGSNIGIGGPAMIEGGGLGVFKPEEVGPMDVQVPNGVVDIAVQDEAEAVAVAKQYISYFQGPVADWQAPDERALRFAVPENRLRYYDMRAVIAGIADLDSMLEIRQHWGPGMITAFIRVEGQPMGVVANNPGHLSGAIDADAADKGARFLQLCDAFDIPILSLCDCPGIMVGPEIEKTALVRHAGRMFVVGANIDVPLMTIVTRKAYGLGAQAMAGGSFKSPLFTVTWPTGEFGGMGLEGAVKLGYRKELQAIEDPEERRETYEKMVADSYERGKAVNMASHFELDDVIDPADTRRWITAGLRSVPPKPTRTGKKRPNVDTW